MDLYAEIASLTKCCSKKDKEDNPNYYYPFKYQYEERRFAFVHNFSWAVPSFDVVTAIAKFIGSDSAVEIGAGGGLWAHLLREAGTNVLATDSGVLLPARRYTTVITFDAVEIVTLSNFDVMITIWPPYRSSMAFDALSAFKGNKVVYIGEHKDGCTGNDEFHELLRKEWNCQQIVELNKWPDIFDRIFFYTRKHLSWLDICKLNLSKISNNPARIVTSK